MLRRASVERWGLLLSTSLLACASQREITRSALVPAITPPVMTGQPIDNGRAQLTVANSTYLRSRQPEENSQGANAGLYIPRTQFALQALFRIDRDFSLGPKVEIGMNQGAEPIADNIAPKPDGATVAIGPAFQYSIPVTSHFRIGLGLEMLMAFAPYNKFVRSSLGWEEEDSGVDTTLLVGMALMPSFRWGPVVAFAGIAGRNQPTNTANEIRSSADLSDGDDVRFGPMYLVTFGGLRLRFLRRLELTTSIYYPISTDPVDYGGPALSVSLGVALGQPHRERPRSMVPQPPIRAPYPTPPPTYAPTPAPTPAPAPAPTPAPLPEDPPGGEPVEI